jgi:hypothetical protein
VLIVATQNFQTTDGDEGAVSGVVDSSGDTWTKGGEFTNGQGTAQAGAVCSIWWCKKTNTLASGGTITASFTNATSRDESAATAWEFTCTAGATVTREGSPATLANDAADAGSLDVTTPNAEYLRIRGIASDLNSVTQMTATASWSLFSVQRSANVTGAQSVRGEFRIVTGTNAASDPTVATADHASVYIALKETAPTGLAICARRYAGYYGVGCCA